MSACEGRGADLFLLARGGEPPPGLEGHVAACPSCREELAGLRALVRDLPAASAGVVPRPATREAVLLAVRAPVEAPPAPPPPPPLAPLPRGRLLRSWVPAALAAASVAAAVFALSRPGGGLPSGAAGVEASAPWGSSSLQGFTPGRLAAGTELAATGTASLHLGPPLHVEAVLGEGARLRVPEGSGGGRSLELLAGVAWFDPGGPAAAAGVSPPPFLLRAGGVEVEDRGATFAVERRASGAVSVTVEAGRVAVRSRGREVAASGPSRVDASPGGEPGEPRPAEPSDATAWFAFPEVRAEIAEGTGEGRDLVVTLLPSVPRAIRIAPWDRADPLFTVRAEPPDGSAVLLPVRPRMLRRKPPDPDPDGGFLLKPERPYRMVLDAAALGLRPGTYRVQVLYSASRPGGGLWRGTRPSNTLELVVP